MRVDTILKGELLMPINENFQEEYKVVAKDEKFGYDIWAPSEDYYNPPEKLGIHGTSVAVDFDICIGDGACIDVCPEDVYEWVETPGHPASDKKAAPARQEDCIACLACEDDCPVSAIKITPE